MATATRRRRSKRRLYTFNELTAIHDQLDPLKDDAYRLASSLVRDKSAFGMGTPQMAEHHDLLHKIRGIVGADACGEPDRTGCYWVLNNVGSGRAPLSRDYDVWSQRFDGSCIRLCCDNAQFACVYRGIEGCGYVVPYRGRGSAPTSVVRRFTPVGVSIDNGEDIKVRGQHVYAVRDSGSVVRVASCRQLRCYNGLPLRRFICKVCGAVASADDLVGCSLDRVPEASQPAMERKLRAFLVEVERIVGMFPSLVLTGAVLSLDGRTSLQLIAHAPYWGNDRLVLTASYVQLSDIVGCDGHDMTFVADGHADSRDVAAAFGGPIDGRRHLSDHYALEVLARYASNSVSAPVLEAS